MPVTDSGQKMLYSGGQKNAQLTAGHAWESYKRETEDIPPQKKRKKTKHATIRKKKTEHSTPA